MERVINILKTKEGIDTLKINNIFLHSKYYPYREAKRFIDTNMDKIKNKKYIVIYGIGLGYHIKALLKEASKECKVFAFDLDLDVIKISKDLGVLDEIKNDSRIEIFYEYDKEFLEKFSEKMSLVDDILIYKPSLRTTPLKYEAFIGLLNSYELAKISVEKFANMAIENEKFNLNMRDIKPIEEFIDIFSSNTKPIIIAAGGPSLEKDLKIMKEKREKIIIFAMGRSLDILMKNSIKPNMITIIDPQQIVYTQIKDYLELDVPLCFLSTASKSAVEAYKGSKYIFFNDKCSENIDNLIINTGKSVAIAALDIAIKTGTKEIIFCGQDLAFTDDRFHAGDKEKCIKSTISNYKKVLGINGNELRTTSGMLEFKRNIEGLIKDNPNIKFFNSSDGAKIEGTCKVNLDEYIIE